MRTKLGYVAGIVAALCFSSPTIAADLLSATASRIRERKPGARDAFACVIAILDRSMTASMASKPTTSDDRRG